MRHLECFGFIDDAKATRTLSQQPLLCCVVEQMFIEIETLGAKLGGGVSCGVTRRCRLYQCFSDHARWLSNH